MVRRALLTDGERERIAIEGIDDQKYVAVSRVRRRVRERLTEDIKVLQQHNPGLLDEVREVVCEDEDSEGER